jgi:hypothetical protein
MLADERAPLPISYNKFAGPFVEKEGQGGGKQKGSVPFCKEKSK